MARKSKYQINKSFNTCEWKVGVYLRLSADEKEGENESNSVINQRELILQYLKALDNYIIIDYYVDDGFTGTNFKRPAFKKMIADITSEKVNTIIVKDLSRFGRNYIEVGHYLEHMFPLYNVRFISITDNIDSYENPESINNMIVPFKNLLNDEYARDISKKVKSALISKSKEGKWVGGTAPYGYMKDPNDIHKLIINPEESEIAKMIFKKSLEGDGRIKICKYLNDNFILCRREIQRRNKNKLSLTDCTIEREYLWGTTTIGRMLENEAYIGNITYNKTGNYSYKNRKTINKPKSEWVIVKNTHEALISEQLFNKVQKEVVARYKPRKKATKESIYNGILKCNDCNSAMIQVVDNRGGRNISDYLCLNHQQRSNTCSPHKIDSKYLNEVVLKAIKHQVKIVMTLDKVLESLNNNSNNTNNSDYEIKIQELINKESKIKKLKKVSYEDWKFEKITKEEFLEYSKDYDETLIVINKEIEYLKSKINTRKYITTKDEYWIDRFRRNKNLRTLNSRIIKTLIKNIYVTENGNIRIVFNFEDEYMKTIKFLESMEIKI